MQKFTINIKINNILVDEFVILDYKVNLNDGVLYKNDIEFSLGDDDKQLGCKITLTLKTKEDREFLKLQTTVVFYIKPEDFKELKIQNKVTLPAEFLLKVCDVSMGVLRGILFSKLEKTDYNQFILPLVDLKDVIVEDQVFEFDD